MRRHGNRAAIAMLIAAGLLLTPQPGHAEDLGQTSAAEIRSANPTDSAGTRTATNAPAAALRGPTDTSPLEEGCACGCGSSRDANRRLSAKEAPADNSHQYNDMKTGRRTSGAATAPTRGGETNRDRGGGPAAGEAANRTANEPTESGSGVTTAPTRGEHGDRGGGASGTPSSPRNSTYGARAEANHAPGQDGDGDGGATATG